MSLVTNTLELFSAVRRHSSSSGWASEEALPVEGAEPGCVEPAPPPCHLAHGHPAVAARFRAWLACWRPVWVPAALALAGVAALGIDLPVARWFLDGRCPWLLAKLFALAEVFGHGLGVAMILAALFQLDRMGRWAVPRIAACTAAAGISADLVKLLIVRVRPRCFDFTGTVADTFGRWFPLLTTHAGAQSFPSGHVATAVGLAVGLTWLYPQGRYLFAALAVLAAFQRMESGAHYPSDVLFAAALGYLVAQAFVRPGFLDCRFDRMESRWKRRVGLLPQLKSP